MIRTLTPEERKATGYDQVVTDPDRIVKLHTGNIVVLTEGKWFDCHPPAEWDCPNRRIEPRGWWVRYEITPTDTRTTIPCICGEPGSWHTDDAGVREFRCKECWEGRP